MGWFGSRRRRLVFPVDAGFRRTPFGVRMVENACEKLIEHLRDAPGTVRKMLSRATG